MEYELKVLEHIITVVLNPSKLKRDQLNDEFLGECKLLAETEKERIMKQFTLMVFNESQESRIESYFRKHQAILIKLADIVFNYLLPGRLEGVILLTNENSILDFYKEISRIPEELLNFIEINYPGYFDREAKIPNSTWWLMAQEIKRNLKLIKKELGKFELDEKLIKIIRDPFEDYLTAEKNINYRNLAYLKELQQALIYFSRKNKIENANEQVCQLLLYRNFNSLRFYNYYINQLEERTRSFKTIPEQIEFYSFKIKLINQLQLKLGLVFKPGLPSIKDQIGSWICEELYFLEKRQRLLYQSPVQKNEEQVNEPKVQTSLSVAHLALAVKLLIESKVITNKNSSELLRMVAKNFKTDRQELISEDSLRNKSYNFESATVDRLKDEIIGLMNLVRKY